MGTTVEEVMREGSSGRSGVIGRCGEKIVREWKSEKLIYFMDIVVLSVTIATSR